MPLGALALVPSGLLLVGLQLGWFSAKDATTVPLLLLGFAVPLQLVASVFAFLGRDSMVATGFGLFTGSWLAFGLNGVVNGVSGTSHVMGVFFLAVGVLFMLLTGGGVTAGKVAAGAVILVGSVRFTAAAALSHGLDAQLAELEHEAGVREQL